MHLRVKPSTFPLHPTLRIHNKYTLRPPTPTMMRKSKRLSASTSKTPTVELLTLAEVHQQWTAALALPPISSIAAHTRMISHLKIHHEIQHNPPVLTPRQMAPLYLNLGLLRAFLGDYWFAEICGFRQALKLDEGNVVAWYGLGIAKFLYGDLKNSRRAFGRCLGCFGKHETLEVEVCGEVGGWLGTGLETEEDIKEGGVWRLAKTRVLWNLDHTRHEMGWKRRGRPRPADGKCGLNGIPVGVLFGPGFNIPTSTDEDLIKGRLVQMGMLAGQVKTSQDMQREKEEAIEEELKRGRKTLSNIHPALRPKPALSQHSKTGPSCVLYDIPESAEPLLTVPSFPVLQPQQTFSKRLGPLPGLSPLQRRPTRAKTEQSTQKQSFPVPQLQPSFSNAPGPKSSETHQSFSTLGTDLLRSTSQEELKQADNRDQASIRPASSRPQQILPTVTDPPPIPPRSYKRINIVESSPPSSTQPQSSKLQQASPNLMDPPPSRSHLQKNLEMAQAGDHVQSSSNYFTSGAKDDVSLGGGQALHSPQAPTRPHNALPDTSSALETEQAEAVTNTTSTIPSEPSQQITRADSPNLTNRPSWWSLPEEEIDRLNKMMYENIARSDAIAGRPKRASSYKVPIRRDSLLPPADYTIRSPATAKSPKPDPFANLLPFGFNRISQIAGSGSPFDTISTSLRGIYDQDVNAAVAGEPSPLKPASAPISSTQARDFCTGQTSAPIPSSAPAEWFYESHHAHGHPTGPTFPAPDTKKIMSPLSPATTANPPAKDLPPLPTLAKIARESRNKKGLQLPILPTSTSETSTAPDGLFESPSKSIRIELPDMLEGGENIKYHFRPKRSTDELDKLFRSNGGCILGKNIIDELQRAREHQQQRKTEEQRRVERELKEQRDKEKEEEQEDGEQELKGLSSGGLLRPAVFKGFGPWKDRKDVKEAGKVDLLQPKVFSGFGLKGKKKATRETWKVDEDGVVV